MYFLFVCVSESENVHVHCVFETTLIRYTMLYGFGVPLVNHDKRKTSVIQLIEQVKYYPVVGCTYARMIEN